LGALILGVEARWRVMGEMVDVVVAVRVLWVDVMVSG